MIVKAKELKLQFSRRFTCNQTHTDNSSVWHQKFCLSQQILPPGTQSLLVLTKFTTLHSKSACLNKFFYLAPKMWLHKFYYLALKVCLFQLSIIQLTTLSIPNNTSRVIVYSSLITNVPCMAVLPVFSQSILKKSANISFTTVVLSVGPETNKWVWGILKWARSFQHKINKTFFYVKWNFNLLRCESGFFLTPKICFKKSWEPPLYKMSICLSYFYYLAQKFESHTWSL